MIDHITAVLVFYGIKIYCILPSPPKVMGGYVFVGVGMYGSFIGIFIGMFVNNFLAAILIRLSPNLVSHTLGHRGHGD